MADLIDREVAQTTICEKCENYSTVLQECKLSDGGGWCKVFSLYDVPTVDAKPVRHGRWETINPLYSNVYCSECGAAADKHLAKRYKGCPFCLCVMDATDTNDGGKGDEEMDLSPLDFLAAEYDRKHPQGIRFVDCMEGADDGACKKV